MSNPGPAQEDARKGAPRHSAGKEPSSRSLRKAQARLRRRWPRRALVAVNIVVAVCIIAMASAYVYVRVKVGSIATDPSQAETPTGQLIGGQRSPGISTDGLHPENILLIGNQTRQGLTPQEQKQFGSSIILSGSLADIMMILHLDPSTDTASILSIPRDLFSPMPAGSPVGPFQKMDAALNDGKLGPDNLMKAIQGDLGIPINHFIELNFNGFINTVNALGGINVYFPEPVYDAYSLLYVPNPGCIHLNGYRALTLVRARHLQYDPPGDHQPRYLWPQEAQSDLARIGRTHTFLKIVADTAKAKGLTNPITANNFLDAVIGQMTVDAPLKSELLTLILHYRHVNIGAIKETTLPTTGVNSYYYGGYSMGDVLFPVQPSDNNVIRAWDPTAFPAPVPPTSVSVVSIAGDYEAAVAAGDALASHGLHVSSETLGTSPSSTTETWVLYHSLSDQPKAMDVMKYLSGSVMMQLDPSVPAGTVQVQLGSAVSVAAKAVPTTATTTGGQSTTSAAGPTSTSTTTAPASSTTTSRPQTTTTTVPTPGGAPVSSARSALEPWDPRACPAPKN